MKTFGEVCQEHTAPLMEALALLNRGDGHAQRKALEQLEKALMKAEVFAERHQHVEVKEADNFRSMLASARRIHDHHSANLVLLPPTEEMQRIVIAEDENPQPPPNAITITRSEAKDPFYYRRAKEQADREHRPLWFVD